MYFLWLGKQKIGVSVLVEFRRPVLIWLPNPDSLCPSLGCRDISLTEAPVDTFFPKEAALLCQQCHVLLPALGTDSQHDTFQLYWENISREMVWVGGTQGYFCF